MSNEFLTGLQAASNAVAGNVAGPVDILSLLLRKAGLPVPENAVGGSNWMTQKGLMAPVRQGASQVIGETAGLLGPAMVSQFGPQIARGLLSAGDNLAAPRTMNPQTGAVVWHGSPHKFDKFDSSRIGTGEGAQAYGHGLYLADSPGIAEYYRASLAPGQIMKQRQATWNQLSFVNPEGQTISGVDVWKLVNKPGTKTQYGKIDRIEDVGGKLTAIAKNAKGKEISMPFINGQIVDPLAVVSKMPKGYMQTITDGAIYKVDLPDDKIAKMLDWDAPLRKASQKQYEPILKELGYMRQTDSGPRQYANAVLSLGMEKGGFGSKAANVGGQALWKKLVDKHGSPDKAAAWLQAQGIPGIRYLDGNSRSAGAGSRNYVVFPGEEDALRILERNGGLLGP